MTPGGQPGNKNASKSRIFSDRLRMTLLQEPHRLRTIAEQLIRQAEEGEPWAIKELFDRLEGKAVQTNTLEDASGNVIMPHLQVTFVKPDGAE